MKECLSDKQRIYHLVADQYVIVDLEASSAEDAVALKEKITDKLHNFIVAENYEAIFSISIGVINAATFCEGTEECRKKFEFALKQAKSMGKNGFYIFDQDDYEVFLRKGRIIATLRNAIVNHYDGFEVYYQPIVDCQSEQIIGADGTDAFFHDNGRRAGVCFTDGVYPIIGRDRIDYSRWKIYFERSCSNVLWNAEIYS